MGANSALEKRCDTLASRYYRRHTPFCEAAGRDTLICGGGLEWAHVFTRGYKHMRYQPYNHLILCFTHHRFYTGEPNLWRRFVQRWFPERWDAALVDSQGYGKPRYEYWIEVFKN